jgi:hypothetical protein
MGVVINGQRFECEHSPEEKAIRKRAQMTFWDYILEEDNKKKEETKGKCNGAGKPRGNIAATTTRSSIAFKIYFYINIRLCLITVLII